MWTALRGTSGNTGTWRFLFYSISTKWKTPVFFGQPFHHRASMHNKAIHERNFLKLQCVCLTGWTILTRLLVTKSYLKKVL